MANTFLDKLKKFSTKLVSSDEVKQYAQRLSTLGESLRSGLNDLAANASRDNEYDAQFTPEYFDSNPEKYGRIIAPMR